MHVIIVVFCCLICFLLGMIYAANTSSRPVDPSPVRSTITWKDGPNGEREAWIDGKRRLWFDANGDLYTDTAQPEEAGE